MDTRKIYAEDVYCREAQATVVSVSEWDGGQVAVFDQTVFFPEGGGQSCDTGEINGLQVMDVQESPLGILHKIIVPEGAAGLTPGDSVMMRLDWQRRFDNMQRHCGEHILSGMFFREYGGVNRGFHMGEEYMTIDISLEEKPEFKEITWEMAQHVEQCANQAIWENQPVITRHFDSRAEAERLPLRKKLALEEDITIVCVGDPEHASDCVACCGTHPATAGQVGLIKLFKVEKNKGMFRIYCEAGARALRDYEKKHNIVMMLGNKYSAGPEDLMAKLEIQEAKNSEVRNALYHLKQSVIRERQEQIGREFKAMPAFLSEDFEEDNLEDRLYTHGILLKEYDDLRIEDLLQIGKPFLETIPKLLVLREPKSHTLLLFSNGANVDCGALVKQNAAVFGGKGGGRPDNARALFARSDDADMFLDAMDKLLR